MMNINRHNYEEHFILYMDNELSDAERRMVEDFAEKNPDLKDELDILLQSKLVPNQNIVFAGKNELFKYSESSFVTSENYEELLLLYIDNELTPELRSEVEKFIETSPKAKQELAVLQKTKLQTEEISFPAKETLYRRAEKVRVVSIKWLRIAAAAVILLAIGLTAVILMNNNTPASTETEIVNTNPEQSTKDPVVNSKVNTEPGNQQKSIAKKDESRPNNILQSEKSNKKDINNKIKNELIIPDQNMIANNNQNESNNISVSESERSINVDAVTNVINNEKTLSPQYNPQFAVTNNVDKPYIMIADPTDNTEEGKNKLRGFFRKATRFLEKTTNISATDDDERLLIGGFAVKLK